MLRFGMGELVIVFLIILVLFGARRLPEIGRSLGKAIREFRKAGKEMGEDDTDTNARTPNDDQTRDPKI